MTQINGIEFSGSINRKLFRSLLLITRLRNTSSTEKGRVSDPVCCTHVREIIAYLTITTRQISRRTHAGLQHGYVRIYSQHCASLEKFAKARPGRSLAGTHIHVSSLLSFRNILRHTHGDFILRTWCEGQRLAYGLDDPGFDSWKGQEIFLLRDEDEILAFLGHYAAYSRNCIPTFRANLSVPCLRIILIGFLDP